MSQLTLVGTVAIAIIMAGCTIREDSCGRSDIDSLGIGYGIEDRSRTSISFYFFCEAAEESYDIDRYTFAFRTPMIHHFAISPEVAELSPTQMGAAEYYIQGGEKASIVQPASPYYVVNFTKWNPDLNQGQEPNVAIQWVPKDSAERGGLPPGTYAIKVGLRSGSDEGGWLDVSI